MRGASCAANSPSMTKRSLLSLLVALGLFAPPLQAADDGASGEMEIGPEYADAPELKPADGVPRGNVKEFTMESADSKIYPGLKGPYTRKCAVYVPAQYKAGSPAAFIVVQDGIGYSKKLTAALD